MEWSKGLIRRHRLEPPTQWSNPSPSLHPTIFENVDLPEKKYEQDFSEFSNHSTSTKVLVWVIHNFYNVHSTTVRLDSPHFEFQSLKWCLRIYQPLSFKRDTWISKFVLVRLSSNVPYKNFRLLLKRRWHPERVRVFTLDNEHEEYGVVEFFEFMVRVTNQLTLMCEISYCESPALDAFAQTDNLMQDRKAVGDLCQNLKSLLLDGQDHDVVLKVKDKEFRAHQNILRARSHVFQSMLNHNMTEKNCGVIDIPDCEPGAFQQFLFYLYSAEVESLDVDNMLSLYYVADKYDANHLKEECRAFIKESLSSSNITDVIEVALNHSDADMLQCATEYFVEHIKMILLTVEWQSFMKRYTTQANELIIKAVNKMSGEKS